MSYNVKIVMNNIRRYYCCGATAELTGFPTEGIFATNAFTGKTDDAPAGGKLKFAFKPYEVIGLVFSQSGKLRFS